jgi:5-methylcytosine-specific restriction endonuclease McrA
MLSRPRNEWQRLASDRRYGAGRTGANACERLRTAGLWRVAPRRSLLQSASMKRCLKCDVVKPLKDFYRYVDNKPKRTRRRYSAAYRTTADGYRAQCKACSRRQPSRSAAYREEERRRAAVKKGKEYTPRAVQAARRAPTREQQLRRVYRVMRALLKVRCAEQGVEFSTIEFRTRYRNDQTFQEKQIARTWARKAASGVLRTDGRTTRKVCEDGTLTPAVVQSLFAAATICPYCRRRLRRRGKTLDHVIPVSRGGIHSITNVLVCCGSCNSRKGTRTLQELGWSLPT